MIDNLHELFSYLIKNRLAFEFLQNGRIYVKACFEPKILCEICQRYEAYFNGETLVIDAAEITQKIMEEKS